jgi:hypothetical protein
MSHIVTVRTQVQDPLAIQSAHTASEHLLADGSIRVCVQVA